METIKKYENFPLKTVLPASLHTLAVYTTGLFLMFKSGFLAGFIFAVIILGYEFRLIRFHCTNCYYWGKTCGFARGRISSLLFKKGNSADFCKKKMTWKDMIPDLLITFIPIFTGIILLIINFSTEVMISLIFLGLLITFGNGYVRGSLTCSNCKQKDIGCPADELFNKRKPEE